MYTITGYTIAPASANVTVALSYEVNDPLNGMIAREGSTVLQDGVAPLDSLDWGDDKLMQAVAQKIGCDIDDVQMATSAEPLTGPTDE